MCSKLDCLHPLHSLKVGRSCGFHVLDLLRTHCSGQIQIWKSTCVGTVYGCVIKQLHKLSTMKH